MLPGVRDFLKQRLTPDELDTAEDFLSRGFSPKGEMALADVFARARGNGKTMQEVVRVCETEWRMCWGLQLPKDRGDPDAPAPIGQWNCDSLSKVSRVLDIPNPVYR